MKTHFRLLALCVGLLLLLTSLSLYSLPRLAAERGAPCVRCHVNPNGGGMRNEFGHATAYNDLCWQQTKKYFEQFKSSPKLTDYVTYGLDYRMLYDKDLNFFRMQTDFYLSLELLKHTAFNFTISPANMKDSYLLLKLKDDRYWLKAGRFYPAFGLRDPDHTTYVRTVPQLGSEQTLDGVSVGGNFFNGSNITLEFYQPDKQKIVTLHSFRAGYLGPFGFLTGISWRQSQDMQSSNAYRGFPIAKSFFGGLSYDHFTALAEVQAVGKGNEQRVFYAQLEAKALDGLYFLTEYNFHDPDWAHKSGSNQFYRFSCEFFPVPFVEIRPSATLEKARGQSEFTSRYFVQLHVNY
jgi:hypothetical protein